jgi:hypothetical protein
MMSIAFPETQFRTRSEGGQQQIFDALRKQWLRLSPEEWVRQNFIQYLVQVLQYPEAMIAVEKSLELNGMKRRFDLLVYDTTHKPWMLVECKATSVALGQPVLEQVLRYNISIPVPYLIITNGTETRGWRKEAGRLFELDAMPLWEN